MAASKQASKQARTYTHTLPQCSHASVGLTQACPNNYKTVLSSVRKIPMHHHVSVLLTLS